MKTMLAVAMALLLAGPAAAGEPCSGTTQECLDYMATKMKESGWVGVELDRVGDAEIGPMVVTNVVDGSPAEGAGIEVGDVLVAMNGIELADGNGEKLEADRATWKPGESVTWTMKRDDVEQDLTITLAPMPADVLAYYIGQHMLEHATVAVAKPEKAEHAEHAEHAGDDHSGHDH